MQKRKVLYLPLLHLLLAVYSATGIFSKFAAKTEFLSFEFCFYYGIIILLLGIYAIGWQQAIKKIPLTTAFANKAVTVMWGLIWGLIFFDEKITLGKIIGIAMIMIGIVVFSISGKDEANE